MNRISKSFAVFIILILVILSLTVIFATIPFGRAQSGTTVSSTIIKEDTTWTKANSPYSLTGSVAVNKGITLTIEPGVTINLNGYAIQVDGELRAKGSYAEKINFSNGKFMFTFQSRGWNEQTDSGSIIEHSNIISSIIDINDTSPKIDSNSIEGYINAHIKGSPIITNNYIKGGPSYETAITAGGTSIISNNTIASTHNIAIWAGGSSIVSNNIIIGNREKGINTEGSYVYNNVISDCYEWGISAVSHVTMENNLIINSATGIVIRGNSNIIRNNTIAGSSIAIYAYNPSTIIYNNIEDYSQSSIHLDVNARSDIDASFNWWGTTDSEAISQKIHDKKDDFNLGVVTYIPFLTAPNPQAPSINTPISTSNPSPTVPELSLIALPLLFIVLIAGALVLKNNSIIDK